MIADVLHFSFTVRDIDRSIEWYTEVLGLELVHRQRGDNPYTRQLVGMDDAVLEVAQFRIPGHSSTYSSHMLELVQYVDNTLDAGDLSTNRIGVAHLAFIVTDIHERYERMRATGVAFVNEPVLITEGANKGGYACYLRDPDGCTLELLQFNEERACKLGIGTRVSQQRVTLHSVLHEGHEDGYRTDHRRIPDDLAEVFRSEGITDWEIWRSGRHLFHLVTCADFDAAMLALENNPANVRWQEFIGVHIARFEGPDGEEALAVGERVWGLRDQFGV